MIDEFEVRFKVGEVVTDIDERFEKARRKEEFKLATITLQTEEKAKRSKCGCLK